MSGWTGGIDNTELRVGGPAKQDGELVRDALDFLRRGLKPLAETKLRRRDVERRDDPAPEVSDRRRRADQAELELLVDQRIPPVARSYNPLVELPDVAYRVGS